MSKVLTGAQLILLLLLLGLVIYLYRSQPRIAYVRSQELLEKFQGTIEAREEFENQKLTLTRNVDSLRVTFDQLRQDYFNNVHRMSEAERKLREEELDMKQNQFIEYNRAVEKRISESDNALMQQVLDQVNSSIEEFAKQEGYDIVLGTTSSGSLLYGKEKYDVTELMLMRLNDQYKGIK